MGAQPKPDAVRHCLFETAFDVCGIAWGARGLIAVQLADGTRVQTERRLAARSGSVGAATPPPWAAALISDMQRYLTGIRIDFSGVGVDLEQLEPFRRRLYTTLRTVGFGTTVTYRELAERIGATGPEAARDVGAAMGRNPVPIVIPCHRVLAAGGKLGGFSAPGGVATKARLLALEGVYPDGIEPRLPGL
jgi:methylated-DNA-[protein]-cysteine S-methyltransferase